MILLRCSETDLGWSCQTQAARMGQSLPRWQFLTNGSIEAIAGETSQLQTLSPLSSFSDI